MKIKQMTATFGTLQGAVLEPEPGLTVFSAPNESGKSTWAAFLTAMLYGIDSRARSRAGQLSVRQHYQPWSGAPMEGAIRLEWQGRDITICRRSSGSTPFSDFSAVYTETGDPVPGLTAASVGETLTGVGREMFVRSVLVGEQSAVIGSAPELERRIAALATAGQEDSSYSEAADRLHQWANRRQANRSKGMLPHLEQEIRTLDQTLDGMADKRGRLEQLQRLVPRLEESRRGLMNDLEVHRRLEQKELNRRYGEAREELEEARRELDELPPPHPAFAGLSPKEARQQAIRLEQEGQLQAEAYRRQIQAQGAVGRLHRRRALFKGLLQAMVALMGFGGLVMVIVGFVLARYAVSYLGFGSMLATVALSIPLVLLLGGTDQRLARLAEETAPPEPAPIPDVDAYLALLARRELLEQQIAHCARRVEDWKAQGAQELDTLEMLHLPALSREETSRRLARTEEELARHREEIQLLRGELLHLGNPLVLESRRAELWEQRKRRQEELSALTLAAKVLEEANQSVRERFSPALNGETGRIFAALTGGRHEQVTLARDLSAQITGMASPLPRSALFLSHGSMEQLYLALRLALCQLAVPNIPLLLDDALASFDDSRAEQAMELLHRLSRERQILLFSCHGREARWAEAHGIAVHPLP